MITTKLTRPKGGFFVSENNLRCITREHELQHQLCYMILHDDDDDDDYYYYYHYYYFYYYYEFTHRKPPCSVSIVSENDESANTWVIFKSIEVFQTTIWEGNFSIASCIYRCLENKTCVAVNYYGYEMECYGLHDVTHLHRRRTNFRAILAVIENRCRSG